MNKVENPWEGILEPNIFLEKDKKIIEQFNLRLKQKPNLKLEDHDYYIHPDLLPEPYMGNPDANVVLLFANPGYGKNERTDYSISGFKDAIIKNLTHSKSDYPYYYLNPDFIHPPTNGKPNYSDGGKWVRQRMKEILIKIDEKELTKKIFTIQLHPYHSAKFKPVTEKFVGHEYTMSKFKNAVERAKDRKALIICARSYKHWNKEFQNLDPINNTDLKTQLNGNFIEMLFPRTTYFTPKHFGKGEIGNKNFETLLEYLKGTLPK